MDYSNEFNCIIWFYLTGAEFEPSPGDYDTEKAAKQQNKTSPSFSHGLRRGGTVVWLAHGGGTPTDLRTVVLIIVKTILIVQYRLRNTEKETSTKVTVYVIVLPSKIALYIMCIICYIILYHHIYMLYHKSYVISWYIYYIMIFFPCIMYLFQIMFQDQVRTIRVSVM